MAPVMPSTYTGVARTIKSDWARASVSVACGLTPGGLPVGMQLIAGPYGEAGLLGEAGWCEGVLGFGKESVDPWR